MFRIIAVIIYILAWAALLRLHGLASVGMRGTTQAIYAFCLFAPSGRGRWICSSCISVVARFSGRLVIVEAPTACRYSEVAGRLAFRLGGTWWSCWPAILSGGLVRVLRRQLTGFWLPGILVAGYFYIYTLSPFVMGQHSPGRARHRMQKLFATVSLVPVPCTCFR